MAYDPEKHHRRSIRLSGHDYAGGGLYFVTICAHPEAIAAASGAPFGKKPAGERATQASPVRALIEERMRITAEKCPGMEWVSHVIMPDHFHALVRMPRGHLRLGDVIGGFKSAVSREMRRGEASLAAFCRGKAGGEGEAGQGEAGLARTWLRNYYESIVRTPEATERIIGYIRMNPWRCVQDFGNGLKGMGNPALWNMPKIGLLCSRGVGARPASPPSLVAGQEQREAQADARQAGERARQAGERARQASPVLSGFHSPMEREYFERLLAEKRPVIWCPAWGLDTAVQAGERARQASPVLLALEENRMLILEMRNVDGDLAAAEQRNRFVLEQADQLWLPHVSPNGMLARLVHEMGVQGKMIGA